ncbi:KdsC family phosphatase [Metabacillus litoralis]|uniref:KdsC family phosphatase n=1 Tax=Metabacillus litoralis TaxID=152268 RepID=UPI0020422B48|nr:HAD-IIIA family hydrolase [Metabacillus litoralis]MCM3652947.1 HAD-IIIA family hydrolase [Metabacillus litoralis]
MDNIKLIVLDVDGVLTDGKLHIGSDGEEYKSFHTQDGMGISLARYVGIKFAIITGRTSKAVSKRADELKIDYIYQGVSEKIKVLEELRGKLGIKPEEICYVGDDINDLPILKVVGFPCAPNNAVPLVKQSVRYIAPSNGGEGAVREIIEEILSKRGNYGELIEDFIAGKVLGIQ